MKPILFNTEMVRAILDSRKTATRRLVKPCHLRVLDSTYRKEHPETPDKVLLERLCEPPYRPGDTLYVRETWHKDAGRYMYKANYTDNEKFYVNGREVSIKWSPSIHMPKEAARLFLRVKGVRVERLQDIDYDGCKAEGIRDDYKTHSEQYHDVLARRAYPVVFSELWDSTIKPADRALYGWGANPWVWVIEFERVTKEEAEDE